MDRNTGLDPDQTRRQALEDGKNLIASQLLAHHHEACSGDPMCLKDVLRQIQPHDGDLLPDPLPRRDVPIDDTSENPGGGGRPHHHVARERRRVYRWPGRG